MAIYHLSIKIVTRGKGKSVVAAAAYRAKEIITNEYDGVRHSYTRKKGVVHKEILLPENAPAEYMHRGILWNSVEKVERYKTAQLAREVEVALPVELSLEQNISLVREYVNENFVLAGMCADICIHDTGDGNPHAHILLTMRPIEKDGQWGAKSISVGKQKIPTVDWNDKDKAEVWREKWAVDVNAFLRINGYKDKQVDHRSYERQGVDIIPTVKLGTAAHQMEKRGIQTERGDMNREIVEANSKIRQIQTFIKKLKNELRDLLFGDKTTAEEKAVEVIKTKPEKPVTNIPIVATAPRKDTIQKAPERKLSWKEQLVDAKKKADEYNAGRAKYHSSKRHRDFDR